MASRRVVLSLLLAKVATQDCTVPGSNIRALQNALTRIKARNAYQCTTNTDMSIWDLGGTPAFHNVPPTSTPPDYLPLCLFGYATTSPTELPDYPSYASPIFGNRRIPVLV